MSFRSDTNPSTFTYQFQLYPPLEAPLGLVLLDLPPVPSRISGHTVRLPTRTGPSSSLGTLRDLTSLLYVIYTPTPGSSVPTSGEGETGQPQFSP